MTKEFRQIVENIIMSTENKFEWTDELVMEFIIFKSVFHAPDFDSNVEIFKKYKAGDENFCWAKRIDRQPLFQTEDGVNIFEGERYYVVIEKDGFGYEPFSVV